MTKPHKATHRPGCTGPMKPPSRVAGWEISRCAGCGCTEVRRADETEETRR